MTFFRSFCKRPVEAAKNAVMAPIKATTNRPVGAISNKGEQRKII
jgi:hypothetical protein